MSKSSTVVSEFTSLTFRVYRHLGWIPIDDNPTFSEKLFFVTAYLYAVCCVIQEMIWFIANLGRGVDTFLSLTNVAPCMGFVTLAIVKMSAIYFNRVKVKNIFERLEHLCWESTLSPEVEGIVRSSLLLMKILTVDYIILIWMFNLMPLVVIIIHLFTDGTYYKTMPYFLWYPWDVFAPIVYEVCYVVLMWAGWVCAIGILSTDLMFITIMAFLNMQFSILGTEIKRIVSNDPPGEGLREWIDEHNELLEMSEDMEGIFAWTILINFFGSSVIICLVGLQTILGIEPTELVKFCLFLLSSLIQIFIVCWHGQKLTDLTSAISDDVYNSDWMSVNEQLKKDLKFIIMRTQKPSYLTAWKFSKVSLHSYGVILSTATSYFAFMRSVYDETT